MSTVLKYVLGRETRIHMKYEKKKDLQMYKYKNYNLINTYIAYK